MGAAMLVPGIDSIAVDGGPAISGDGLTRYFGSTRDPGPGGKVWQAARASIGDPFGDAMLVANVNSNADDSPVDAYADGLTLYLSPSRVGG